MKLIEAMKQIKDLMRKADDLKEKVYQHQAHTTLENPIYENQAQQVSQWIQAHSDILKKIEHLRVSIQQTNLNTPVTIELGGKAVTKSIAAWIHRRRDLANNELNIWSRLNDRGLSDGHIKNQAGDVTEVKVVRCYSPTERDEKLDQFRSEPTTIDSTLEVVNAVTDLVEV